MSEVKSNNRIIKAPTGTTLNAKSRAAEAPLRMLMYNLDPDVAERPEDLVVYGGIGRFVNEKVQTIPGVKDTFTTMAFKAFK